MANTVKLKRGSGSDPSASDMVVGEPVIRTDTAELFFKKDDGSVAKVSGGGGGPDFKYLALRNAANNGSASYPGNDFTLVTSGTTNAITPAAANTLLVSYGGVIQKPNSGTSTSGITGFIVDGSRIKTATNFAAAPDFILYQESGGIGEPSDDTVTNAKVTSNAAIAGTKISPNFGSQDISTTGHVDIADDSKLKLGDSDEFTIFHATNGSSYIKESGGGNLSLDATNILLRDEGGNNKLQTNGAGVAVTGNITVTGTVDGVDIAALNTTVGTKLPLAGGTLTGDTTLANTKKVIFNHSSGAGCSINHQSGNFQLNNSIGNSFFISAGALYLRSGGNTDALTLDTSQNATFAGTATFAGGTCNGSFTVSSTEPRIYLTDTNNNSDFEIRNVDGNFRIFDSTETRNCLSIDSSGNTTFAGNVTAANTLSVINTSNLGDAFLKIKAGESGGAVLEFESDEGDDYADLWRIQNGGDSKLGFRSKESGSWVEKLGIATSGAATFAGTGTFSGTVGPSANATYNLGYNSQRWNDIYMKNDMFINDDGRICFGDSNDLQLWHQTGNSYITSTGANLTLRAAGHLYIQDIDGNNMADFTDGGAVELYFDGVRKAYTNSSGFVLDSHLIMGDDDIAKFGNGADLQIYHSGLHSYIKDTGTGELVIQGSGVNIYDGNNKSLFYGVTDGYAALYYNNSKRLETSSSGASVLGSLYCSDHINLTNDGKYIQFGDSNDLRIQHTGSNSLIKHEGGGDLYIDSYNKDIYLRAGDGNSSVENSIVCNNNAGVDVYHSGSKVFETLGNGVRAQGGIMFGSDTADANRITDYEEGSWTPDFYHHSSVSNVYGHYTKIGRMVYAYFTGVAYSTSGSHQYISNLPFTTANIGGGVGGVARGYQNFDIQDGPIYYVENNSTQMTFYKDNGSAMSAADCNGKSLRGMVVYTAAS